MLTMRDVGGLEAMRSTQLKDTYELCYLGSYRVGLLRMRGMSRAEATSHAGTFDIAEQGFLKKKLLITQPGTGKRIATLSLVDSVGILDFADGRIQRYTWKQVRARCYKHCWVDGAGRTVVCACWSNWSRGVHIHFEPCADRIAELELLVLLAAFLAVKSI